ncbi:MAG: hypothetical protein U0L26_00185 [Cellulosilyticum sp.]|nr:hypothetical protein [Cellulosilyticum sp.]MEE1070812.1 hypothetical protein [Cellulosilyticum sp.]
MVEETQRPYTLNDDINLEDTIDTDEILNQKELPKIEQAFDEKQSQEQTLKINCFFIELFICSLLLWSLLFIKQSLYSNQLTATIKQVLGQNIESVYIQEFKEELETTIKQIF